MVKIKDIKIKIFADGADLNSIKELNRNLYISGFTTNPTLMKKGGVKDYKKFAFDMLKIVKDKPVSFEVFSDEVNEMENQAREISSWGKNIYVKIPITNSKGIKTYKLVEKLSKDGIKCNVTAILLIEQVQEIYQVSDPNTDIIISIFAGRIADAGVDPTSTMREAVSLCKNKKKIQILWASSRELINILQANSTGCHIITVPHQILKKIDGMGKDLKQLSLETVKTFLSDAVSAGYNIKTNK